MIEHEYLTVKEAAHQLGVSRQTIYNLIEAGKLRLWRNPLLKRGGGGIPRADVEALRAQIEAARPR